MLVYFHTPAGNDETKQNDRSWSSSLSFLVFSPQELLEQRHRRSERSQTYLASIYRDLSSDLHFRLPINIQLLFHGSV